MATVAADVLSAPCALMAGTLLWAPAERGEMDVTTLLSNARSPDQATRQAAEAQIEAAKASNLVRACTPPLHLLHTRRASPFNWRRRLRGCAYAEPARAPRSRW